MTAVAFIPARGGSKSIPDKNVRPLAGRPLIEWVIQAALRARAIDRVYVSSDSERIRSVAAAIDDRVTAIDRSPETATDTASSESALLEFAEQYTFDRVVFIQATSPLLTGADIDGALALLERQGAQSLVSVTRQHRFRWTEAAGGAVPQNYDPRARPRRQDWSGELVENGAFYVTGREALLTTRCRVSGRIALWEMPPRTAVELDEPHDWAYVAALLGGSEERERVDPALARRIRLLITDCDGVLTDGGMYYGADGEVLKKFNTRDGMGLARFTAAGGVVALMTGENTLIAAARAKKLGIERVFLGCQDKLAEVDRLRQELGMDWSEIAFIGDDLNDLAVMQRVGLAACPSDAEQPVRSIAAFTAERGGGQGCVRELVDAILSARGDVG